MILKQNSWHSWLYRLTYWTSRMPNNLCAYFWKLVASILLIPFSFFGILFCLVKDRKNPEDAPYGIMSLFYTLFGLLLSAAVYSSDHSKTHISTLKALLAGFGLITGLIVVVLVPAFIAATIDEWRKKRKYNRVYVYTGYKEPRKYIFFEFIKAKKQKYCPKIEWK